MEESKTFVAIPKIQSSTHRCVVSVRTLSTKSKPHAPIGYSSLTIHRGIPGRFCSCCEVRLDFCQHLMRTELLWVMISPEMVELLLVQPGSYISITAFLPGKVQVNFDTETFLEVWFGTHWLGFFHCLTVWFLNNFPFGGGNGYLSLSHAHTIIYCYYSWELSQKDLWLESGHSVSFKMGGNFNSFYRLSLTWVEIFARASPCFCSLLRPGSTSGNGEWMVACLSVHIMLFRCFNCLSKCWFFLQASGWVTSFKYKKCDSNRYNFNRLKTSCEIEIEQTGGVKVLKSMEFLKIHFKSLLWFNLIISH